MSTKVRPPTRQPGLPKHTAPSAIRQHHTTGSRKHSAAARAKQALTGQRAHAHAATITRSCSAEQQQTSACTHTLPHTHRAAALSSSKAGANRRPQTCQLAGTAQHARWRTYAAPGSRHQREAGTPPTHSSKQGEPHRAPARLRREAGRAQRRALARAQQQRQGSSHQVPRKGSTKRDHTWRTSQRQCLQEVSKLAARSEES